MSAPLFSISKFIRQVQNTPDIASQILYIEGDRNYSVLFTNDKHTILSAHTLVHFEKLLPVAHFVRVHKSYLVNIAYIECLGATEVRLTNGSTVPVARRRRKELIERISDSMK